MLITDTTILTPAESLKGYALRIVDGVISEFIPAHGITCGPDEPLISGRDGFLVPGFLDLQINGGFGFDFTASPEKISEVAARLPCFGVTSFLPTIITSPKETLERALSTRRTWSSSGAEVLGLHLEGPFLNPEKRGAHRAEHLRMPDSLSAPNWTVQNGVRLVTLAPELPNALDFVRNLKNGGIVVSAGHSLASFDEALESFRAGVEYGTHLWNAMGPIDHRRPGLSGALLADREIIVGLIADGIHVHPAMIDLAWRLKGPDRLNLVSDGMAGLGMKPGRYELGGQSVQVGARDARLDDGTLAGSVLPLDAALRNFMCFTGCSLTAALQTITLTPARLLGLEDRGAIAPGKRADLVLLSQQGEVAMTWVAGKLVYEARSNPSP